MKCIDCNKEIKDDKYKRCIVCGFSICSKCDNETLICSDCMERV